MASDDRHILKVRKQSLRWLGMLARQAEPAFAAVVEPRGGPETAAVARGLRHLCTRLRVHGGHRVWVFHRWDIDGEIEMDRYLHSHHRPRRKAGRPVGNVWLDAMVEYSHADNSRAGWRATVEALVVKGAPPFGLVVHLGRGDAAKIEGDIAVLTPLMTDTTLLVVARQERKGPQGAYGRFCRDGWGGVVVSGIGLLQRRRDRPMVKE